MEAVLVQSGSGDGFPAPITWLAIVMKPIHICPSVWGDFITSNARLTLVVVLAFVYPLTGDVLPTSSAGRIEMANLVLDVCAHDS